MKKISIIVGLLLLLSIQGLAEEGQNEVDTDAGITPDSPFYGLDKAFDKLSLKLTFNKAQRAQKGLRIAEERLAEVRASIEAGDLDATVKGEQAHKEALDDAEAALEGIESNSDTDRSERAWEEVEDLQDKILSHADKVAAVKDGILERQGSRMTPEQIEHLESVFNKIKERARSVEDTNEDKKERIKLKYKALAKKTDAEMADVEEKFKAKFVEKRTQRAQQKLQRAKRALERARDDLTEEQLVELESKIQDMEQRIANAERALSAGDDQAATEVSDEGVEFGNEISVLAGKLRASRDSDSFNESLAELKAAIEQRHLERVTRLDEKSEKRRESSLVQVGLREDRVSESRENRQEKSRQRK